MNRKSKLLLVAALSVLALALVSCKPVAYYLERVYKAYGTARDAQSGAPLESVEVFISTYQYSELTNSLGDYELELPEGKWQLDFVKDGYETYSTFVTVNAVTTRVKVDAQLVKVTFPPPPEMSLLGTWAATKVLDSGETITLRMTISAGNSYAQTGSSSIGGQVTWTMTAQGTYTWDQAAGTVTVNSEATTVFANGQSVTNPVVATLNITFVNSNQFAFEMGDWGLMTYNRVP